MPADLMTVRKSASTNGGGGEICWKICQLSENLPAERGVKSTDRFADCQKIGQQKWGGVNPPAEILAYFCQFCANFSRNAGRRVNTEVFHTKDQLATEVGQYIMNIGHSD